MKSSHQWLEKTGQHMGSGHGSTGTHPESQTYGGKAVSE